MSRKRDIKLLASIVTIFVVPLVLLIGFLGYVSSKNTTGAVDAISTTHPLTSDSLLADVNEERTKRNIQPLSNNSELYASANAKCLDTVANKYYDHTRPSDGKRGADWIADNTKNWKVANENLNKGNFTNSIEVVQSWMNSPAHRNTILDPKYTDTGIATCQQDGQTVVVEHFAAYFSQAEIQAAQPKQTVVNNYQQAPSSQTCYTTYSRGYVGTGISPSATTHCY